tara:strand:+ start:11681 stop:13180 length:1500 start_codon:yes stop_codon:yes gene_type:complete
MLKIINSKQSKELDNISINKKLPSEDTLIDNAGKAIAYHIIESIEDPFNSTFLCISGKGNNGMDAIVTNKYLIQNNIESTLLLVDHIGLDMDILKDINYFTMIDKLNFSSYDYIVDGLFGTGLNREVDGVFNQVLKQMQKHDSVISIDMPSGIYTDSGNSSKYSVSAIETITFTYPKVGHYISDGYKATGDLSIYPIGHSHDDIDYTAHLIEDEDIGSLLHPINLTSDKYSNGKILSLAGSRRYTGAALLSGTSAIKSGGGMLRQIYPLSLNDSYSQLKEAIDYSIEDHGIGFLAIDHLLEISSLYDWSDCLMIGPGLSPVKESIELISMVLSNYSKKCVIDATALSAIEFEKNKFQETPDKSIMTPHYNELARMLNISKEDLDKDVIKIIKDLSVHLEGRVLILKGFNTIVADGYGDIYICEIGTTLLSTAGSGDVLTGIISSYVARGYALLDSALIGVSIHSRASRILKDNNIESITASELIPLISDAQNYYRNIND